MDLMSCLWSENKDTDTGRYGIKKFSAILSKMQKKFYH